MNGFLAHPRARAVGILALLFGLYGVLFYFHQRGEKQNHRLIDISVDTLTGLKVIIGETVTLELKREGNAFVFVQPYAGLPADPRAIKNYLSVLDRVPVRRRWTEFLLLPQEREGVEKGPLPSPARGRGWAEGPGEGGGKASALVNDDRPEKLQKYGIGPASPRIVLSTPKREYAYALGNKNPVAPEFYVARLDTDEIALVPAPSIAIFQVRGIDFRNRKILPADVVLVGWEMWTPGRPLLKGEKHGEEWRIAEANGPLTPCDRRIAKTLEDRINSLRLSDFDALDQHLSVADAGLSAPAARLTVRFATGPAVEWAFGAIPGKDVTTQIPHPPLRGTFPQEGKENRDFPSPLGRGQGEGPEQLRKDTYTLAVNGEIRGGVPKSFLASWPQQATDLQRKTLIDFPLSAIGRFSVTQDEATALYEKQRGKWFRLGRERRPVDVRTVQTFLLALAKIKIEKFDFTGPVDPVTRQYVFFDGDGTILLDLRLGTESAGGVPATFGAAPYRFTIPATALENLSF